MMDWLGIRWLYEPEIHQTRHGGYLPDFYLPDAGVFIEVKGPEPGQVEIEKALDVESSTGCPVVFAYGKPEMDYIYLIGATLSYYGSPRPVNLSIYKVSQGIDNWLGEHGCREFSCAGRIQPRPTCTSIGDAMSDLLDDLQPRSDVEAGKLALNAMLNAGKMTGDTVLTLPASILLMAVEKAREIRK
jgi:hypothetical protein